MQSDGAPLFFEGYNGQYPARRRSSAARRRRRYPYRVDSAISGSQTRQSIAAFVFAWSMRPGKTSRPSAMADYTATSGRLDWAIGDDSQRTVTVRILNDGIEEVRERFGVDFSEPDGGVELIAARLYINIADDDEASSTPPPTASGGGPTASGGGGSVSWATQLALLTLLCICRRRIRRAA